MTKQKKKAHKWSYQPGKLFPKFCVNCRATLTRSETAPRLYTFSRQLQREALHSLKSIPGCW